MGHALKGQITFILTEKTFTETTLIRGQNRRDICNKVIMYRRKARRVIKQVQVEGAKKVAEAIFAGN